MLLYKKIRKKISEFSLNYKSVKFYNGDEKIIYVHLKNRTKVRTYLNLIIRLRQETNAPIVFAFSPIFVFVMSRWLGQFENLYLQNPFYKYNKLWVFSHSKKATFRVSYDYSSVVQSNHYVPNAIPYILHPINYIKSINNNLKPKKEIGILFSGNVDKSIYDTDYINEKYKLNNRYEIYQKIKTNTYYENVVFSEFKTNLNTNKYQNKLVQMQHQLGAIPIQDWLYYLSGSRFMLCAPGMTMPMCHNVLEALSVGVVPIINYPNWLNPSLVDGENCLYFDSLNSLETVIARAINMSDEEYERIQKNAIEYYQTYYANFNFSNKINSQIILLNEHKKDV